MKKQFTAEILVLLCCMLNVTGQTGPRNLLTSSITKDNLAFALAERDEYTPTPLRGDSFWENLTPGFTQEILEDGERYLGHDWPSLLARRYMDFDIDGDRSRYGSRYHGRRHALSDLVLAEIIEDEGRFMDDIINGIWLILEETTWVVPAHSGGDKLHERNDVFVDLFSAETAALLAWTDYYLGDKFDAVTPLIRERIYDEVNRRVLQSMLDHEDFWYMGYTERIPNNWNPWIVSNWLTALLLLEEDQARRVESTWKALDVLDRYLNHHPADGGCDEGPGYWGRAAASLFDCLFLLEDATDGAVDVFDEPLVKNMGTYIYKIHIDESWFVNFADGSAINHHDPRTIFRIGRAIGDRTMMAMASERYSQLATDDRLPASRPPFGQRMIPNMQIDDDIRQFTDQYQHELFYFFPDLQVLVARESLGQEGLFMAIKGGFNDESHNHNDVGSFVVFADGKPLFIDAGVGEYTRKTFSPERYDIWTMQSAYHNLPTLNGEMQKDGREYRAENFELINTGRETGVSMDISGAWPDYAYTPVWIRSMTLDRRRGRIELVDEWQQERQLERNEWHFITAFEPEVTRKGEITISNGSSDYTLSFGRHFSREIEEVILEDRKLQRVWGDSIWRITLTTGKKGLKGKEKFIISEK